MKVFGHIVVVSQVIAVGPLMEQKWPMEDITDRSNRRTLFFNIYAGGQVIKVETAWLSIGYDDRLNEEYRKDRIHWRNYTREYQKFCDHVLNLQAPKKEQKAEPVGEGVQEDGKKVRKPYKRPLKN